jgi:hypothetical protein
MTEVPSDLRSAPKREAPLIAGLGVCEASIGYMPGPSRDGASFAKPSQARRLLAAISETNARELKEHKV